MKPYAVKLTFICAVLLLASLVTLAQTPTPKPVAAAPAASSGEIPNPKIAIVNVQAFAENIAELRIIYEGLANELAPRRTEIESMKASMDAKQKQLEEGAQKMTPQQLRKLQDDVEQLKKDGNRMVEDYQALVTKREEALTGTTYNKVFDFLFKYCAEKGITLTLNAAQAFEKGLILYVDPKADITTDFINTYNKANPAATAQKAPAATTPKKP